MQDLYEIKNWLEKNFTYEVKINLGDHTSSLVVEVENETKIARFVLWDDKSVMLEIIDIASEKYVINQRRELKNNNAIKASFREFAALLKQ